MLHADGEGVKMPLDLRKGTPVEMMKIVFVTLVLLPFRVVFVSRGVR